MTRLIPKSLWIGFSLIVLGCLALTGLQLYQGTLQSTALRQDRELVVHTFNVISTAQTLERSLRDAERGQRGYLLTGDKTYLPPYKNGVATIPALFEKLKQLTADNPAQQRRMQALKPQIDLKLTQLAGTIEVHDSQSLEAARQIVLTNAGLDTMIAIDDLIDAAVADENTLLTTRMSVANNDERGVAANAIISSVLGFMIMATGFAVALLAFRNILKLKGEQREAAEQFDALANGISDVAFYMIDPLGKVVNWNTGAKHLKGYVASEVVGRSSAMFYTEEDQKAGIPKQALEIALQEGKYEAEGLRVRKDGSQFMASVFIEPLRNSSKHVIGFAKITRDITERIRHEEALEKTRAQLAQSQKLDALGQLTGGIAHDFNNILQAILGGLEILRKRLPDTNTEALHWVDMIKRNADRATTLTQRLLAFSRRQPLAPKPLNLNKLVEGMVVILRQSLGESIDIETALGGGLWWVEADASELETAILNLAVNARDAMPEGGKLTIETSNMFLDEAYAAQAETKAGQYVMIAVSDTGTGMTRDTAQKAFEPFFTTKDIGKGTGLGLAQVHGFIKQSHGHVAIYSEPGEGTTVKIYLPRLVRAQAVDGPKVGNATAPATAGETILIVEDDEDVRTVTATVLGDLGYRVLSACDGLHALDILGKEANVDLLFTDVGLPNGMNGRQLAEKVRQQRPGLRVLFTTGYARNAIIHHGRLDPGVELIVKPFSVTGLADKVRRVLDAPPPDAE
jgi:PAS domain S-box-containing protein